MLTLDDRIMGAFSFLVLCYFKHLFTKSRCSFYNQRNSKKSGPRRPAYSLGTVPPASPGAHQGTVPHRTPVASAPDPSLLEFTCALQS